MALGKMLLSACFLPSPGWSLIKNSPEVREGGEREREKEREREGGREGEREREREREREEERKGERERGKVGWGIMYCGTMYIVYRPQFNPQPFTLITVRVHVYVYNFSYNHFLPVEMILASFSPPSTAETGKCNTEAHGDSCRDW